MEKDKKRKLMTWLVFSGLFLFVYTFFGLFLSLVQTIENRSLYNFLAYNFVGSLLALCVSSTNGLSWSFVE